MPDKNTYRVLRGQYTQYDEAGQPHVFNVGDEISLTEDEMLRQGDNNFELVGAAAPVADVVPTPPAADVSGDEG